MESSESAGTRAVGPAEPAELIAIALALEERDLQDVGERRRSDREIGAMHPELSGLALLRVWIAAASSSELLARVARVRSSLSMLRGLLFGAGLFLGWAAAATLLQYEVHAGRINIVVCAAVLVVIPFALWLFSAIGTGWALRGTGADLDARRSWRSVALTRLAMSLLSVSVRQDIEVLLGRLTAHARLYARVQWAQLFVWSQWVGLAFMLGVVVATLAFVVFTDLAFGWSTTLDVDARSVHPIVALVSKPWAWVWPAASPSLDLVESTRHFRAAAEEHIHFVDPIRYGGWWPFLVATMLFYGLLPRLIATALGTCWLRREVGLAIGLTPGVDRLLDRLATPIVETQATEAESEIGRAESGLVPVVSAVDWIRDRGGDSCAVVRWAEALDDASLQRQLGCDSLQIRDAGGRRSLKQDADLIEALAGGAFGIAFCVRGYEPPVLEVLDVLAALRSSIGPQRPICVLLVEGAARDLEAWRHKLVSLGDPGLSVAPIVSGEARTHAC